ncbi:MAG TPA: SDR family NAD(P)-dependent oxidoreductase [Thermoguttaceae bacterium]|nr:SDR family NAD(P)-dependent oxidoreductase [Thermoguttaceae bacterium]
MDAKRIVVTGVGRGLGRAMVEGFVERGHVVAGCSRSAAGVESLRARFGPPCSFDVVDVADDRQVRDWAGRVLAGGSPDIVVNNAGVINANAPLWQVSAEEFSAVIDVNVKGTVNVIRHFMPAMIERGTGVIVNFSSGWGRSVSAEVAPYCASKWAIEGLTQALAEELPRGMAAVALNPGIIDTDMLRICFGDAAASYPKPAAWAARAAPFILNLGPKENGRPLRVPGGRD